MREREEERVAAVMNRKEQRPLIDKVRGSVAETPRAMSAIFTGDILMLLLSTEEQSGLFGAFLSCLNFQQIM